MRDPDLILRAQRAAVELERAWERWRTMHGLGADPLPPVSSYVGYSLEEPWGQPRVVFGIDAREAEQFAALLDRHDCAGPVYAAMTSRRADQESDLQVADPASGRVRVPSQVQPVTAPREVAKEPPRADPLLGPLEPPAAGLAEPGPAPVSEPAVGPEPPAANGDTAASVAAFRPRHESGSRDEEGAGPAPAEEPKPAEAGASGGWRRAGRLAGGHPLPRQKRAGGAGKGSGSKQEGKDRAGLADLAAELAGWAAGELPGQASHRRAPRPVTRPDRPAL